MGNNATQNEDNKDQTGETLLDKELLTVIKDALLNKSVNSDIKIFSTFFSKIFSEFSKILQPPENFTVTNKIVSNQPGFCKKGADIRLQTISNYVYTPKKNLTLIGISHTDILSDIIVGAVIKQDLPHEGKCLQSSGFHGICIGCKASIFLTFRDFAQHINLKVVPYLGIQQCDSYFITCHHTKPFLRKGDKILWQGSHLEQLFPKSFQMDYQNNSTSASSFLNSSTNKANTTTNKKINPYDTRSFLEILIAKPTNIDSTLSQSINDSSLKAIVEFTTKTSQKLCQEMPCDSILEDKVQTDYSHLSPIYKKYFAKQPNYSTTNYYLPAHNKKDDDSENSKSTLESPAITNNLLSKNCIERSTIEFTEPQHSSKRKSDSSEDKFHKKIKPSNSFSSYQQARNKEPNVTRSQYGIVKPNSTSSASENLHVLIIYCCIGRITLRNIIVQNVYLSLELSDCFGYETRSMFTESFSPKAKLFLIAQYLLTLGENECISKPSLLQFFDSCQTTIFMFSEVGLNAEIILPSQAVWLLKIITSCSLGRIHIISSMESLESGVLEALQAISLLPTILYVIVVYQHYHDENLQFCIIAKENCNMVYHSYKH